MNDGMKDHQGHILEAGKFFQELIRIGIISLVMHPCERLLELLVDGRPFLGL